MRSRYTLEEFSLSHTFNNIDLNTFGIALKSYISHVIALKYKFSPIELYGVRGI